MAGDNGGKSHIYNSERSQPHHPPERSYGLSTFADYSSPKRRFTELD